MLSRSHKKTYINGLLNRTLYAQVTVAQNSSPKKERSERPAPSVAEYSVFNCGTLTDKCTHTHT